MTSQSSPPFWQYDIQHWFDQLGSSREGLSGRRAEDILSSISRKGKAVSAFERDVRLFLGQFKSPLMMMLIGAVVISAFVGDMSDVFIILFIVLSTGLLSFLQERNAVKVVEKLQSLISIKSTVWRDGRQMEIPADQIVPGDVLELNAGDLLPADCLIIESNELYANESSLTGESYPVRKEPGVVEAQTELAKRTNCLWEGTNIVSGHCRALVIQTGEQTIFGSIAKSAGTATETAFEKGIKDFGYFLMKITLVLAVFILVVNMLNHKGVMESALFALALAVGMAPELLPAITTIAMSAGAKRLLEKKVIVKKLNSIQNLGEVDLLCTDKTGTITEGAIRIAGILDGNGKASEWVETLAYWNASLESGYSNPIDEALKRLPADKKPPVEKIGEIPYDFIRKRLSIAVSTDKQRLLICKGAFAQILEVCSKVRVDDGREVDVEPMKADLETRFAHFGEEGLRAIAVCYKEIGDEDISKELEKEMVFAGFVLFNDPIKAGIQDTMLGLSKLKIGLKIITGDNRNIAMSIARQMGIKQPVILTGKEMLQTSPEALQLLARRTHIFAEVEPQQKERIILALKQYHTVAYMGDGINDVSAINAADVGISVENAVDVAREAADFVLMEKNLSVLLDGFREGRKTFANTLKYIFINTGSTFGNMFSVAVASLMLPFLPMLPKQILLTNFLTDFPYLSVAADNVDQEQINRPGKWNLSFVSKYMVIFGIHSSLFDVITFATLLYVMKAKESVFQTGWFVVSILTELLILFIIRTHKNFFRSRPARPLMALSLLALVITLALPYSPLAAEIGLTPLPPSILFALLMIVTAYVITADLLKVWFFRKHRIF